MFPLKCKNILLQQAYQLPGVAVLLPAQLPEQPRQARVPQDVSKRQTIDGVADGQMCREIQWKCQYEDALIQPLSLIHI